MNLLFLGNKLSHYRRISDILCKTIKDKRFGSAFTPDNISSALYDSQSKVAFTLAEVLITLGIIGVVAALTLPALINNYEKQVTVNRLKVNFNIMSNAIRRAEADFGDITSWELLNNVDRGEYDANADKADAENHMAKIVKTYFLPYLSGAQYIETGTLADLGYKRAIVFGDGSNYARPTAKGPFLRLPNGTVILWQVNTGLDESGKRFVLGMLFIIDIDGPNGKNIIGKDVFYTILPYAVNTKFMFLRQYQITDDYRLNVKKATRSQIRAKCIDNSSYCGALIQIDGWDIKDDYPYF